MNRIPKPNFLPKLDILNLKNPGDVGNNIPKMEPDGGDLMENMA